MTNVIWRIRQGIFSDSINDYTNGYRSDLRRLWAAFYRSSFILHNKNRGFGRPQYHFGGHLSFQPKR